jgi:hypothetical protein
MATAGGRTSEPAAVRGDAGSDRAVADTAKDYGGLQAKWPLFLQP